MLSGVPNLAFALGYTNASWTLKADLTCEHVCRLLNHMAEHGYDSCTPRADGINAPNPFWELSSGYVRRDGALFPKQGSADPWYRPPSMPQDRRAVKRAPIDDRALEFARAGDAEPVRTVVAA